MKKLWLALISLWSASSASVAEAGSPPEVPNITIILPVAAELASAYPDAARGRNIDGYVLLFCTIRTDNFVDCHAGQWSPPGYGFESAAVQIAAKLHVRSNDAKSYATSRFNLPVHFPADPPNATSGPPTPTLGAVQAGLDNMPVVVPLLTIIPLDPDDVVAVFPNSARGANVGGRVMLLCTVQENNGVKCSIDSEQPTGYGFGDAALELSTKIRVKSQDQQSHVGYRLNIPIRFPPDPPASAASQ